MLGIFSSICVLHVKSTAVDYFAEFQISLKPGWSRVHVREYVSVRYGRR